MSVVSVLRGTFERLAEQRGQQRPARRDGEFGEGRGDAEFGGLCAVDAPDERRQKIRERRVAEMPAPPRLKGQGVRVIPGADESRVAERAQRFAHVERELSESPVAQDEPRARFGADFGKLDAKLLTEPDDRWRGEQRVCRPFGDAVFSPLRLNQPARALALFEQRDSITFFVERVSGEQARDPSADDRRLAPRRVERADHTQASDRMERSTRGNSGSPLKARAR